MTVHRGSGALVGLYGGSFDPVHRAHVEVARRALAQVPCDEIWFVPAARTPFKPDGPSASATDRVEMLELALRNEAAMSVCHVELSAPGRRSVETVQALAEAHPAHRWRWIMGEDSFEDLPRWAEPELFTRLAPPVVQPRPGSATSRASEFRGAPVVWLRGEEIDLSSSVVRDALARGERPDGLHPDVLACIEERALYRQESTR